MAEFGQVSANVGQICPTLTNVGHYRPDDGDHRSTSAHVGQSGPSLCRVWPTKAKPWPPARLGRNQQSSAPLGQHHPNKDRSRLPNVGRISSPGAFVRQLLHKCWAMSGQPRCSPGSPGVISRTCGGRLFRTLGEDVGSEDPTHPTHDPPTHPPPPPPDQLAAPDRPPRPTRLARPTPAVPDPPAHPTRPTWRFQRTAWHN